MNGRNLQVAESGEQRDRSKKQKAKSRKQKRVFVTP